VRNEIRNYGRKSTLYRKGARFERPTISQTPGIGERTVVESKIPGLTKMVVPAYYLVADLPPNQNETWGNPMVKLEDERFEVKRVFILEAAQGQELK
jgi:hypothetical protein